MPKPESNESENDYVSRCMSDPEMQQYPQDQRFAVCKSKYASKDAPEQKLQEEKKTQDAAVVHRKISVDYSTIDNSKVIRNDSEWLVLPIVIASEIVQQYDNGYAYKPGEELEKMAINAELVGAKPIKVLEHPQADTNYLIQRQSDISGKATNFRYVKNLLDAKTKRPCRKGVLADGWWSKTATPPEVIADILSGKMRDCSIGFSYDTDTTSGEFDGSKYDYVQRNIYLDHVAAPIPAGRCPGPICGIGYDSHPQTFMSYESDADCPVCTRIKTVGFAVAGKRLYKHYGADVLEVIEGHPLPTAEPKSIVDVVSTDLDAAFNEAFSKLKLRLQNSQISN